MKKSTSFLIIIFIYIFTSSVSIFLFSVLPWDSFILKVIVCDLIATFIIFLFSSIFRNSSTYDPYWSVAPLFIFPFFLKELNFKTLLLIIPIVIWGIRLTGNWMKTFKSLRIQDWRYDYYKHKSRKRWPFVNFFGIHLMPTIIVIGVMLPGFLYLESKNDINLLTIIGCFVSFVGIALEDFADRSAHRFRKVNREKVITTGLWKYSRHPNYLGEISFWWGVYLMMLSVEPSRYLFIVGPIANTLLFIFISIPLMENRQLQRA
jgi:steroid 5-alpha reductase family enzyme